MVDLSKIDEIEDEVQLQKMLSDAKDLDERKVIRTRLLAVKEIKSKEREKEMQEREKRREQEIADRKNRKEEEKKLEMQRLEELAKTSTADRINNDASKLRQDYIKEKAKAAEEEKKKNMEHFEEMAKEHKSAHEKDDSVEQKNLQLKSKWAADDKKQELERAQEASKLRNIPAGAASSKITASSSMASKSKTSTANAFAMFQGKDKEAGGTGKATVQVASATNNNPNNPQTIKDNLLKWCQLKTQGYPNVNITNFSSSWANGMAFCALVHQHVPDTFDFKMLNPRNRKGNFELAFRVAEEKCDIAPLLDVEDMLMMGDKPDWKCVFTYVQSFYRKFELEPKAKAAAEAKKNET